MRGETVAPAGAAEGGARSRARYVASRLFLAVVVRGYVRLRVSTPRGFPTGPCIVCFNHLNWADPFVLLAVLPWRPRVYLIGPSEADMNRGWRNRLIGWTGLAVPVRPGREDMLAVARRVERLLDDGAVVAVAGEGRIHRGEATLLPLQDGVAWFALRAGAPIVPCAINGTSRICFGRRVRIRFGEPIPATGRPTRDAVDALTEATWTALHDLCQGYPDPPEPGPLGRWLTDVFNEWPPDGR